MELAPGTVVAERFVVEGLLGRGGMALVYRVRHRQLGTAYALKVLAIRSPSATARLVDEGRMQSALRHPNVVGVIDLVDVAGAPALVLELVDGAPLSVLIGGTPLDGGQVDRLGAGILAGMAAAHRLGLVHRDLKPGNVLVALDEDRAVPKVADFGVARALTDATDGEGRRTQTGASLGTPHYMAPEQIRNARDADARADVWALGVLLYELAAGVAPFDAVDRLELFQAIAAGGHEDLALLRPDLPPRILAVVRDALQVDRDRRPADAEVLLARWLDGRPSADPDPGDLADRVRAAAHRVDRAPSTSSGGGTWAPAEATRVVATPVAAPVAQQPPRWRPDGMTLAACALLVAVLAGGYAMFGAPRPHQLPPPPSPAVELNRPVISDSLVVRAQVALLDANFDEAKRQSEWAGPVLDDALPDRVAAVAAYAIGRRYSALEALDKGTRNAVGADGAQAMLDGLTDPAELDRWLARHPGDVVGRVWRALVAPTWAPAALDAHLVALDTLAPDRALPRWLEARTARLDGRFAEAERALARWGAPGNVDHRLEAARLAAARGQHEQALALLADLGAARERWALRVGSDLATGSASALAEDRLEAARLTLEQRARFHFAAADGLLVLGRDEAWAELDQVDVALRESRDALVRWFRTEAAAEAARLAFLGADEPRLVAQITILREATALELPRWSGHGPGHRLAVAEGLLLVLHGDRSAAGHRLEALRSAGTPEALLAPLARALDGVPEPPRVRPELLP